MKAKKILSFIMTASMAASLFTPINTYAAEALPEGVIEKIDFENYEEGTAITSNQNFANGVLKFEGARDDNNYFEVSKDPVTGSKALKISNDQNAGNMRAYYVLNNKIQEGVYKISFNARIANAGYGFTKIGGLQNDSWSDIVGPFINGTGGGIYHGNTWWGDYKGKVNDSDVKYTYIVDMDKKNIKVSIVGGTLDIENTFDFGQANFEKLFFNMDNDKYIWNYETDPVGVLYVDNIEIAEYDNTIIKEVDFEGYAENHVMTNGGDWYLERNNSNGYNTATIATDPTSGSKALKLTKGNGAENSYVGYTLANKVTTGKYIINYDVRIESATQYMNSFGQTISGEWGGIYGPRVKSSGLFKGDTDLELNYRDEIGKEYATFEQIIDVDNKTVEFNVYKDGKKLLSDSETFGATNLWRLNFSTETDNTHHVNGWECLYNEGTNTVADNNPANVLYIDNIKVSTYSFKAMGTSIADGAKYVKKDTELFAYFNELPKDDQLTAENFKLYKADTLMSADEYTIELADGGVKVMPKEGLLYGVSYKLEVAAGVKDINGNASKKGLETSFTMEKYIDSTILQEWNFEGETHKGLNISKVADGDTAEVRKDDYGTNALYIERAEDNLSVSGDNTEVYFKLDKPITSGIIRVTQEVRSENYRAGISNFMGMISNDWTTMFRPYLHGTYYYADNSDGAYAYKISDVDKTKYLTIEKEINMDTGAYTVNYYIDGTYKYGKSGSINTTDKKIEQFVIIANKDQWYDIAGEEGAGKYWIDNVKVEKLNAPEVVWTTPIAEDTDAAVNSDIIVSTNVLLDKASVTNDTITITENGNEVTDFTVSVDGQSAIIKLTGGLKADTSYEVTVKDWQTYGGNGYTMTKPYTFSFTTGGEYAIELSKIAKDPVDATKFNATYDLSNNGIDGAVDLVFASYDANGKLLGVDIENINTAKGEKAYGTVSLPIGNTSKCFIWKDFEAMIPVGEPMPIEVPETTYGADVINNTEEPIKIAFIGGSITEQQQWITPLKTYFAEKFTGREITYDVAGVGGTGSSLQMYRAYNDIIKEESDLVFVDATINDTGITDVTAKSTTYEAVIRQLMNSSHQPSVIAVSFGNKACANENKDAWTATFNAQKAINDYYGIPTIDIQSYVVAQNADWSVITGDGTHPNAEGGKLYAEAIKPELDKLTAYPKMTAKTAINDISKYANAREISWREGVYAGNWTVGTSSKSKFHDGSVETSVDGSNVTVTFYGKAISMYTYNGGAGMDMEYDLDNGAKTGTVSSFVNSWAGDQNQVGSTQAIVADEVGTHTVTFTAKTPTNVKEDAKTAFIMGYFLVY